jgi:hypothetical protein
MGKRDEEPLASSWVEAVNELIGGASDTSSNDVVELLCKAARQSMRVRVRNSHNGGLVLGELYNRGLSWREIEQRTGINTRTARRWAEPPPSST